MHHFSWGYAHCVLLLFWRDLGMFVSAYYLFKTMRAAVKWVITQARERFPKWN